MNTPHSSSHRLLPRALCALGLALIALAASAGGTSAHVSPVQAEDAATRGADWFRANQEASGSLGADWAMTALGAAGINAADVSASPLDASAQDFYLGEWQASGPGGAATDAERGILTGIPGGIQPSRLSTSADTAKSNLVARVAELFDGTQIGDPGLLNDDIFGVLALHQAGAPRVLLRRIVDYLRTKQLPDGGWTWNTEPDAPADTDMTGSAVAAFCAAGVEPGDPDLDRALALLHGRQDPATGGFVAPPETFGIGVNTDTTAWVASGLIQCGIDPQGPEWTTAQGKTPLDYLVSMQRPDGHFDWTSEYAGGAFETYSAVRPLDGVGFSSPAPPRFDGASPAVRPAPVVADGTTVPITLVIDHGPGAGDVRMCRVDIASGSDLGTVLADAQASSAPAGCVTGFQTEQGDGGTRLASLDGVAETSDYGWRESVDGSTPEDALSGPIGFGDLLFLEFAAKVANPSPPPRVEVAPLATTSRRRVLPPRAVVRRFASLRHGRVTLRLHCPRGSGPLGCRGLLTIRFRAPGGGLKSVGSTAFELPSGETRAVAVAAGAALRRALARGQGVELRVTAATRAEDGGISLTHARRMLAG